MEAPITRAVLDAWFASLEARITIIVRQIVKEMLGKERIRSSGGSRDLISRL